MGSRSDFSTSKGHWVTKFLEKLSAIPYANFSFPEEPAIIGQIINAFCSLCGIGIGDHHNDVRGTVAKVLCRDKKGGVEDIQAVLCTTCLMRMKREGKGERLNRA